MTHHSIQAPSTGSKRVIKVSWNTFRSKIRHQLTPLQRLVNHLKVEDRRTAHWICRVIPGQCPFERTLSILGHTIYIPPLCKLNPLFEELMDLRFRALTYLVDQCGEDITIYIS